MSNKGGFHPQSRLATHLDELSIEALIGLESESAAAKDRAFREIVRLARRCVDLLQSFAGPTGPTLALAQA